MRKLKLRGLNSTDIENRLGPIIITQPGKIIDVLWNTLTSHHTKPELLPSFRFVQSYLATDRPNNFVHAPDQPV